MEDTVYCYTKITRFGTKSFEIENILTIENNTNKQLCAFGKSTLVCLNYDTRQTVEVPVEWIESVKEFENSK